MDKEQLEFLLSAKPVEYLVGRKFPDWKAAQKSASIPNFGPGSIPDYYQAKRLQAIKEYRAELQVKSSEDLMVLYQEEKAKEALESPAKAEREEKQRFFNQPSAKADFEHWSKTAYWTLEEAIALAFGKNPEIVTWKRVQEYINTSAFAGRFAKARDLALRAEHLGQLYDPVLPGFFLAWARRNDLDAPKELIEQVEKRGVVVADWKDAYDKLKEQFDVILADRDKIADISRRLIKERDGLKDKVAELDSLAWEGFDPESDTYPPELDIAMLAWRAVTNRPEPNMTAKERIEKWLNKNYPKLSQEARARITVVCNWDKSGGRRRIGEK